eukprot:gene26841-4444_t
MSTSAGGVLAVEKEPLLDPEAKSSEAPKKGDPRLIAVFYCLLNIVSSCGIVFANKAVFSWYGFKFVFALTWIHTCFTWGGMMIMSKFNFFKPKDIPQIKLSPLAFGFVGYIVLGNLSLNINSVGFYQFRKLPSMWAGISVLLVCLGVGVATVTDTVAINNTIGVGVALAATCVTAMYQIWAGTKQKELQANSSQLLLGYTPQAILYLTVLVPMFEPMGWEHQGSIPFWVSYTYTPPAILAIVVSALLGILVSLSTFLVIGATSSLTYNVVGHIKTKRAT